MSDEIKHECGIALIRLRKSFSYYVQKYGTPFYGLSKLYVMMDKQQNRGQDGAGVAVIKMDTPPGYRYISRYRSIESNAVQGIFEKINKKFANNLLDYDKIIGTLLLRNRKFGDRIQLCGRNFTSSVKKFINENISPAERLHLHFLEDDEGTLWAEKIGVAQRAAPNTSTTKFLCITISNDELISIDPMLN